MTAPILLSTPAGSQHAGRSRPGIATTCVFLVAGVLLWIAFGRDGFRYGWLQLAWMAPAVALAVMPGVGPRIARWLDQIRSPRPRNVTRAAVAIAFLAGAYFIATGFYQHREFIPKFEDEHMYLLQMRMLAHGQLWAPQHPLADFFETIHVLVKPVYAAMYFPGAAMLYTPSIWLGVPFWAATAACAGAIVGLMYKLMTELIDGVAGALSALLICALTWFRYLSLIVMSHTVMILLGLGVIWAWLRWRNHRHWGWLVVLGLLSGWAAITRPIDAVAYVAPVGLALLWDLRNTPWKRRIFAFTLIIIFAAPFLSLQAIFDKHVTGSYFQTPYAMYLNEFSPQKLFQFTGYNPQVRPKSSLQQKQDYFDQFTVPELRKHTWRQLPHAWLAERFPLIAKVTLPSTLLLILLPAGLLGLNDARRRVLASVAAFYIVLYGPFAYLLPHYTLVIVPSILFLVLMGKSVVERTWTRPCWLAPALTLAIAASSAPFFAELNSHVKDDGFALPVMTYSHTILPNLVEKPAVVLFTYHTGDSIHEEPVYNLDAVNPDDEPIIRANDLGFEKDKELFAYYAARQPDRHIYIFDRSTAELKNLGTAGALWQRITQGASAASRPAHSPIQ